jgi:outer membrane protein
MVAAAFSASVFLPVSEPRAAMAQALPPGENAGVAAAATVGKDVLTLSAAVAEALGANPDTQAALQGAAQARARLAQADSQRRVQVQFTSTASGSSVTVIQPPPAYQNFGTLENGIALTIPTGARPRLAGLQARQELEAAQARFQSARIVIAAQVTDAYFDVLRKEALGEIARETRLQAERQLSEITKRFRAGDVPELDTLRAQVPVAAARAAEYQAESDLAVARQTLNSLLARPLSASVTLAEVPAPAPGTDLPYSQDEARERARAASPDILAATATVRAAEAALAAARRFRDPAVSLQALDTRSSDKTGFARDDTLQASLTIPLSDGGLGLARIKEAEAALAQAQAQTAIARRTVETAVAAAYLTAQSRRKQIQAALAARDIATVSYEKTVKGYEAGLFSLSDLLNAQAVHTQARIAYTQALFDAALATSALTATVMGAQGQGIAAPVPIPKLPPPTSVAAPPRIPTKP